MDNMVIYGAGTIATGIVAAAVMSWGKTTNRGVGFWATLIAVIWPAVLVACILMIVFQLIGELVASKTR